MATKIVRTVRLKRPSVRSTTVTLSADELAELGQILKLGVAMVSYRPRVLAKLKAAMTRLAVSTVGL